MSTLWQQLFSSLVLLSLLTGLGTSTVRGDEASPAAKLGKQIDHLTLLDAAAKPWSLHSLKDAKAVVVVFLSFECPVSTSYSQSLADLASEYGKRGVTVVGICTNDESAAWVARQAKEFKLPFPVL